MFETNSHSTNAGNGSNRSSFGARVFQPEDAPAKDDKEKTQRTDVIGQFDRELLQRAETFSVLDIYIGYRLCSFLSSS